MPFLINSSILVFVLPEITDPKLNGNKINVITQLISQICPL
jgi:hypothetical protein